MTVQDFLIDISGLDPELISGSLELQSVIAFCSALVAVIELVAIVYLFICIFGRRR